MAGFIFEKDLPHQLAAVSGVMQALSDIAFTPATLGTQNPLLNFSGQLIDLLLKLEKQQKAGSFESAINTNKLDELIFDISMETGTGKTYAYTKTMFELYKSMGINKFIIAVPRVAIKAGTVSFLKSTAARDHFRDEYGSEIKIYEVQSQKSSKGKKDRFPSAIADFCKVDGKNSKNQIHVLVINAGMITSNTIEKQYDTTLLDQFNIPHEAIAHTKPILIIDEPHMFKRGNKTYKALMRFKPQFTLRYGATFDDDIVNLVYQLNAVEAFNQDLVKGVVAHIEEFEDAEKTALRLVNLTGTEAHFELIENDKKSSHKLARKNSFGLIHDQMQNLTIESMNKSVVVLSNGLELKKGDRINPYSYAETLQGKMIKNAIIQHFENERALFLSSPRIKPLTLFFIDHIESYRDKDGIMRQEFEAIVKGHIKQLIIKESDKGYKAHLETALKDISALHGGYFSADNADSDEKIEKETLEILHDKETLLDFNNPRRFIFSKWTLREGWDNPNVFTICKLRSSGSETSKLQEVGRGLRLPVTEYMTRDKSRSHSLHYFVDFTESDFVSKLVDEINEKGGFVQDDKKLTDEVIKAILKHDERFQDEDSLLEYLDNENIIKRNNDFKEGGFEKLKEVFPDVFASGVKKGKIQVKGQSKPKTTLRAGVYEELKQLWEKINEKVVLEYQLHDDQEKFEKLFKQFIIDHKSRFQQSGSKTVKQTLTVNEGYFSFSQSIREVEILPFKVMGYSDFLKKLSHELAMTMQTLHKVFIDLKHESQFKISDYLSPKTIRILKMGFKEYLMKNAMGSFEIGYKKTTNKIHPTKLTDKQGRPKQEIDSGDVGVLFDEENSPEKYLFEEIFYDGQLELDNIKAQIDEVIVYTKIPKNSIRIPLVGGDTYSPDFAYVLKSKDGRQNLNFVVETKGKSEISLSEAESKKIRHAEKFFENISHDIQVSFKRQLAGQKIIDMIKELQT